VGAVVSAYRLVIDSVLEGDDEKIRKSIARGQRILRGDFARAKTVFYFDGYAGAEPVAAPLRAAPAQAVSLDWLNSAQDGGTGISLGAIHKVKGGEDERRGFIAAEDFADPSCMPAPGDSIRLHRSDDTGRVSHKLKFVEAEGGAGYWISIPKGFEPGDRVYLIQTRSLSKRYEPVLPHNIGSFRRMPGREKAPFPELFKSSKAGESGPNGKTGRGGKETPPFPEGLYVAAARTEDLYIVQSSRPVKVILAYTRKTAAYLLADNKPPLPFKPGEIILALDPYFPQALAEIMTDEIDRLIERGYRHFVLNNMGHFSLFRSGGAENVSLVAGPWLYMFNSWSLSFISSWGVDGFIPPLENNRQNLDRTFPSGKSGAAGTRSGNADAIRSRTFITIFAWPSLFRIRADLGAVYDFTEFSDNRNESFSLITNPDGSLVIPDQPFSITDKIPFLREAGFKRFIIDLSGPVLKKAAYRDLMRLVKDGVPLPGISRFNWKDGFYKSEEGAARKEE
jgi:putative protease